MATSKNAKSATDTVERTRKRESPRKRWTDETEVSGNKQEEDNGQRE